MRSRINDNKIQQRDTFSRLLRCVLPLLLSLIVVRAWGQSTPITSLSEITSSTGNYIITDDISGGAPGVTTFSGTLTAQVKNDGTYPIINDLTQPLFTTATDATISNIMLKGINISSSGPTGAICGTANGTTRIYNCGILPTSADATSTSSIGSSNGYCGSLVGFLDDSARVINCFSYANITSGSVKAGIVGYNNVATIYTNIQTMVMNCMFYGDITTGGNISPIYGGKSISNDYDSKNRPNNRLNNYNYYLYESPFSKNNTTNNKIITSYNCALAAEKRFLVRFEFYRHLLNSTRELAAWYATDNAANGRGEGSANKMLKWVLDKSIAPYPILKQQGTYPSVVNYAGAPSLNKTLSVTISGVGSNAPSTASITNGSLILDRTDKDPDNFNFNYDKVQLPYYNDYGTGNYTENKVVTGWKVTVTGGSTSFSTTNYDAPNYNFADRDCTGKDDYSTSGRVFAQGAYFNVPTGVSSISIEPYWGMAAYLSDACYDRYGYNTTDNLTQVGGGQRYTNNTNCPVLTGNQKVYTTVGNALNALTGINNPTVYDYAVVLVGNYHHHTTEGRNGLELSDGSKPFTIMSIDLNKDNEPDYCLIYRSGKNKAISPIRFDFITVPGMVMAHKMASNGDLGIPGNCTPKGWFEVTTTGLIKYGQFEHSYNGKTLAPVILMGGVIDQFVSNNTAGANGNQPNYSNKTQYMLFGDNVWFKMLSNGTHMDNISPTPHRPISITGGEFEKLYLSGYFRPDATPCTAGSGDSNAECYIDGGKFGEVAGAGQENISGSVTWIIDHADIQNFYGGGIKASDQKQITGNITTTIRNSNVTLFCGGPKFGDMAADMTVTTTAANCTFGKFFGAGFGGTSIYRECPSAYNKYESKNYKWNDWVSGSFDKSTGDNYRGKYVLGKGVSCGYEYEFFGGSGGNVARLYLKYASFSLAQTNNVSSTLTDCTILGKFYGGGSLGKVAGDVISTLTNCTIYGDVFGAGESATTPTASVLALGGFNPIPNYNETTGVYEPEGFPASAEFTWTNVENLGNGAQALSDTIIKTTEDLSGLGTVSGDVELTISGDSHIYGSVFGGGESSDVTGIDKTVTVTLADSTTIDHNVYGGGNEGAVYGSTNVFIKDAL